EAIRIEKTLVKDGEIVLKGLPFRKGQTVELIVLSGPSEESEPRGITASELLNSGLVGIWADRDDIGDSSEFARKLRARVEKRGSRQ
ncbi:MAG: hypothetical protein NTU88_07470, partial [Armatimonadetes bacterium]|nr:hypothetical protein [Armatimonadota bacterium]